MVFVLNRMRSASSEQENSESEHSEKSPLVSAKLESFAKLLFSRSLTHHETTTTLSTTSSSSKDTISPRRLMIHNIYTYLIYNSLKTNN